MFPLGQTNLICCFSSAPASTSNTPLQLSLLPFASGTPPINPINNHVMSRETSLMASAHGHLNNEVMNNNRPPAPKFRKWLMRNNKSSLSGLICGIAGKSANAQDLHRGVLCQRTWHKSLSCCNSKARLA